MGKEGGNYAYIDGANLHKGIQVLGWELDYRRFRVLLKQRYGVEKVYLFLGFVPEHAAMYRNLQNAGYILIFKTTVLHSKGEVKGNCDGELILQATCDFYEGNYTGAILVTGDGDFACLARFLLEKGKLNHILSPNHARCSLLLKRTNAKITFLEGMRGKLEYRNRI